MNGRRIRRVRPGSITKFNRQIQDMNDSIAECQRSLTAVERSVLPGDWLSGRIEDTYQYKTWRTVGCLNLTDHFIIRYMERIQKIRFNEDTIKLEYGGYNEDESDRAKLRFADDHLMINEEFKANIREFVKNPPSHVRIVRKEDRVITLLTFEDEDWKVVDYISK